MRFGIYAETQCPPEKPHYDLTWEIVRQMIHADAVGFDSYSVIEHHFFPQFGISANPLAMFVAAAQHTQRIRFRTLCHTLPLHNPLVLAGAIAEADLLTHGRLECGLGRGHAWLFPPAGIPLAESRPRYEEALDLLTLAWTQDHFSYEGRYYNVKDVTVVPKPLQKPHPKLYMVGTSESSFLAAGQRGISIAAGSPVPYAVFAPGIDGYKQACAKRGYTPDISFIRLVYLDEDARQVRTEAEPYVRNFLDFNASAIDSLAHRQEELIATGYGFYASGVAERFRHITYDQCIEEDLCFLGTPEQVIAQIRRLDRQVGGLNEMVIISNFGGIEPWKAIKTQELFAKYVMPAWRA
jgi:alkanesulfonate monooxygenase SsuD/methylene tetrahydromethanopterin reductase-like flavin-dependent oxidoreductase (luciferase family)